MRVMLNELEAKILQGYEITEQEAYRLGELPGSYIFDLLATSGRVTRLYGGRRVELCSIVNARSGLCSEDCAFCAQSAHHRTNIQTYPLLPAEDVLRQAAKMEEAGVKRFSLVTSGRGIGRRDLEKVLETVRLLRRETNLHICASLGIIGESEAKMLVEAGVATYHHNLESAAEYYPSICTTHDYRERVQTIKAAVRAGLRVCAGGIMGMGETMAHRVQLALELRELGIDSVPLNFLNPVPGTPLAHLTAPSPLEMLQVVAIFRLVLPRAVIRLCGGRREGLRGTQAIAFTSGVNGLMVGDYLTTRGGALAEDIQLLRDLALEIV
ncbi:biotin synthase [Desulfoscipio geothermicus DSM 3669]|uniref:Biotin synthase n=2 Tax=Desulfoscipio geothermicus TaxID=39060 RepID=A0A1I6DVF7_9FIRM|nr:biotin synthase [Desulfoscipio geothermicus DSM 3669]